MLKTIMGMISGIAKAVGSAFKFIDKKNMENNIKRGYDQEKKANALEEDIEARDKINESNEKAQSAKDAVDAVTNARIDAIELTQEEIKQELDGIEDKEQRLKRERELKAAKELKKRKSVSKSKVKNNKSFNDGESYTFGG